MRLLLAAALFSSATAFPEEIKFWQTANVEVLQVGRFSAALHSQFRVSRTIDHVEQVRFGPQVRFALNEKWEFSGLYYYRGLETSKTTWGDSHRIALGAEARVLTKGRWELSERTMTEWLFGGKSQNYWRMRERLVFSRRARLTPFVSVEPLVDKIGWQFVRAGGGLRWLTSNHLQSEMAYMYDFSDPRIQTNRHILMTTFRFGKSQRR